MWQTPALKRTLTSTSQPYSDPSRRVTLHCMLLGLLTIFKGDRESLLLEDLWESLSSSNCWYSSCFAAAAAKSRSLSLACEQQQWDRKWIGSRSDTAQLQRNRRRSRFLEDVSRLHCGARSRYTDLNIPEAQLHLNNPTHLSVPRGTFSQLTQDSLSREEI